MGPKKGPLHFLGRKNQSLFDTNIKVKEMVTPDNVELMLDSSAIPESGTAKVKPRPTVKHYIPSSELVQGFAVPTPTVPDIPPHNEIKINGLVSGDRWSNGSSLSVPDLVEGEIVVPPPPSVAPPPPPMPIIPPPLDFMGDLEDLDLASIQPPSMPPPKPPSLAPSLEDEDLSSLRPPPMAPPKPPSTCSSASSSSLPVSTPPPTKVPDISEHPKFAPPQSPAERQHKAPKIPPPKPVRLSSIPSIDGPPLNPAPPPPVHTPTPSSFNPQNTAKLYSIPKTSILTEHVNREVRPKSILVLEDSVSLNSVPVSVQVNGKTSPVAPLPQPANTNTSDIQTEKDLQELKATLEANLPAQKPASLSKRPPIVESVSITPPKVSPKLQKQPAAVPFQKPASLSKMPPNVESVPTTPPKVSPKLQKQPATHINSESNQAVLDKSPSQSRQYSPLIDKKLRNLKGSEPSGVREGPAATPLSLLMAAKERDKHRSSLSRENSTTKDEPSTASIQPSASNPNSFIVIPRAASSSSVTSQGKIEENTKSVVSIEPTITNPTVGLPGSPAVVQKVTSSPKPALNRISPGIQSSNASSPVIGSVDQSSSPLVSSLELENEEEAYMPLLPPPPEFGDDLDEVVESPPSTPAPDPPVKSAPSPSVSLVPPAKSQSVESPPSTPAPDPPVKSAPSPSASPVPPAKSPSPVPKSKPPAPPKLPRPETDIKPKLPVQTKSKVPLTQPLTSLSASQATLLSILQKKMLEMDHKITPMSVPESNGDDWGNPLSDEETSTPVVPKTPPMNKPSTLPKVSKTTGLDLNKTSTIPSKTTGLDMRELESKVAQKYQEKGSTSNGPAKQQYGMTFTVRPGTKQPITLVSKGESS